MGGGQVKKLKNFLLTDVKAINKYLLITIILVILSCVGLTSYALFSYETESIGSIRVVYNPTFKPNSPELAIGMIPVYYDESTEVWKKADSSNKDTKNKWYDYDNKMWANAVTVKEKYVEEILTNKVTSINVSETMTTNYCDYYANSAESGDFYSLIFYLPTQEGYILDENNKQYNTSSSTGDYYILDIDDYDTSYCGTVNDDNEISKYSTSFDELYSNVSNISTYIDTNGFAYVYTSVDGVNSVFYCPAYAPEGSYFSLNCYLKDAVDKVVEVNEENSYLVSDLYTLNSNTGSYVLGTTSSSKLSDSTNKYTCLSNSVNTCDTMYKIIAVSDGVLTKVNEYTSTKTDRSNYLTADVGTEISMDDINTMWVWIPRFSATGDYDTYNGTNDIDNPGAFDITFVDNETTAHDAFTFGTQELNGFWVGKFETSHETLSSSTTENNLGCTNDTCSNASGIIIKPDVVSLRYNSVSNFFYASLSMKQSGNSFGFDITKDTTLDTHMMKNNEWGAVAYLTQSIYGRCTSSTSCTEVYINNSTGYYTGRSGGNVGGSTPINGTYPDQTSTTKYNTYGFYTYDGYLLEYNTNNKTATKDMSKVASTTGNIYGVYDMSGGAYDYVMGVYTDGTQNWSGSSSTNNSGFSGCLGSSCSSTYDGLAYPDFKYYNSYTTETNYTTEKLQHALTEIANWFGDGAGFADGYYPWLRRGGLYSNGLNAGVFYYSHYYGYSVSNFSSRFSLTVN